MIIYRVLNKISGKSYIGQTTLDLESRKDQHIKKSKSGSTWIFHKALKSYGSENFEWSILQNCENKEELNSLEKYWINELKSNYKENGYNMTEGGNGGRNEFAITSNSKRCKGKSFDELYGLEKSKKIKDKLSIKLKEKVEINGSMNSHLTFERKSEIGKKANKARSDSGYSHSQETRNKIGDAHRGKTISEEGRKNISQGTLDAMSKIDMKSIYKEKVQSKLKAAWEDRDNKRIENLIELNKTDMNQGQKCKALGVSYPTYKKLQSIIELKK